MYYFIFTVEVLKVFSRHLIPRLSWKSIFSGYCGSQFSNAKPRRSHAAKISCLKMQFSHSFFSLIRERYFKNETTIVNTKKVKNWFNANFNSTEKRKIIPTFYLIFDIWMTEERGTRKKNYQNKRLSPLFILGCKIWNWFKKIKKSGKLTLVGTQ